MRELQLLHSRHTIISRKHSELDFSTVRKARICFIMRVETIGIRGNSKVVRLRVYPNDDSRENIRIVENGRSPGTHLIADLVERRFRRTGSGIGMLNNDFHAFTDDGSEIVSLETVHLYSNNRRIKSGEEYSLRIAVLQ